jgi:hypothetical protein
MKRRRKQEKTKHTQTDGRTENLRKYSQKGKR